MDADNAGAYGALIGAQLLFATLPIVGKVGLETIHFLTFAGVRILGAAAVLAALVLLLQRPAWPSRPDIGRLAVYSLLGIVINQVLFLWGLSLTTATNAALLLTTIPVFTYAIAVALGHETIAWRRGLGIAVAMAGVVVLLDPGSFSLSDEHLVGNLLILVNTVSYSLYLVLSRPLLERVPALTATAWLFFFGSLVVVPLALAVPGPSAVTTIPPLLWLALGYIILGPTVGTYVLNLFALARVRSSTVAAFIYLQPVTTVLLAWLVLGESIRWVHFLAGGLVVAGVGLVTAWRPASRERPPVPAE